MRKIDYYVYKSNIYGDLYSYVLARREKDIETLNYFRNSKDLKKYPKKKSKRVLKKYFKMFDNYNYKYNKLYYVENKQKIEATIDRIALERIKDNAKNNKELYEDFIKDL